MRLTEKELENILNRKGQGFPSGQKQPAKFKGIVEADETGAITYITKKKLPPDSTAASTTVTQNWQQYDLELLDTSV